MRKAPDLQHVRCLRAGKIDGTLTAAQALAGVKRQDGDAAGAVRVLVRQGRLSVAEAGPGFGILGPARLLGLGLGGAA